MIKLALNDELVLTEMKTWRDAVVFGRDKGATGLAGESHLLCPTITAAAERIDGFLMLLQSCCTEEQYQDQLAQLTAGLREFRDWLQQGRYATELVQMLSQTAPKGPTHCGKGR